MKHSIFSPYLRYLGIAGLLCLSPVHAETYVEHLPLDCRSENNLISDACLQQDYQRADANLNRIYKQIVRNSTVGNHIRPPQRAWVSFRDAHCSAWQAKKNHVSPEASRNHCLTILTNERLYTLQNHILAQRPYPAGNFSAQDLRLNQVYKTYKSNLNALDKERLLRAQRAWLTFRDASCPTKQTQCLAYFTRYRVSGLQQLYAQRTSVPISSNNNEDAVATANLNPNLAMNLLGIWKQQQSGNEETLLEFGIRNGVHHYLLRLDNLPFEAGQWLLQGQTLSLVDSDGTERHLYRNVNIQRGFLTMTTSNGDTLSYQRVGAN